uniref:DUF725 domain-containing protein n=1 Tax=Panagrellus redivivus TaxID=6233 RepID=A0A7E4UXN4_PANRE
MRSLLTFSALALVAIVAASDPLAEEAVRDTQRFCDNYAECRATARSQFEQCVGGYTQMILAESEAIRSVSTSSEAGKKCEEQLINSIETEIRPFYERIEHDTFECARNIDAAAFNLGETEQLVCSSLQNELSIASYSIAGATTQSECKTVYTGQLRRCDLVRECCPQFRHCRMKAELDNNVFGKEQRLAAELDLCLGRAEVNQAIVSEQEDGIVAKITQETRRAPPAASTTTPPPTAATLPTLPTLPPPEKVFNNLVGILFPNLATTTTTQAPKGKIALPFGKNDPMFGLSKVAMNKLKQASMREAQRIELERATAPSTTTTKAAPVTTTTVKATTTQAPTTTAPTTTAPTTTSTPPATTVTTEPPTPAPIRAAAAKTDVRYEPEEEKSTPKSTFSVPLDANQALSSVYCENLIECNAVVSAQLALCDTRYAPENFLYDITDFALRSLFLSNSNVSDSKVKHRCLESVDPESQRQLTMLAQITQSQEEACIRESAAPLISNEALQKCQATRMLKVASEVFTTKEIPREKTIENAEKCYSRVRELKQQCTVVEGCCPQASRCASINNSLEKRKLNEITEQLKEEQTLCEKRRMRILNGLV